MEQYRVRQDGTVLKIEADGSITELGKIGSTNTTSASRENYRVIYWFFIVLFFVTTIIGFATCASKSDDYQNLWNQKYDLERSYALLNEKWEKKVATAKKSETMLTKVGAIYPIIIRKISIGNMDDDWNMETDYGKTIYHYSTMYLMFKIQYEAITTGHITLKIKLFRPDGSLSQGSSSPSMYSFTQNMTISSGTNTETLSGWGSKVRGHWSSGTYRIEVWYDDACLKSKSFTIY